VDRFVKQRWVTPGGFGLLLVNFSDLLLNFSAWLRKRQMGSFMPLLIQLLSPQKEDIILDVGAGTGVIAEEISKSCDEVFALEPDPKRVNYIKKKYPQVKAFDGSAEAIQFPEFYFTKIYVVSALHHFKDKDAALYEFYRVLKHSGLLIIKDSEPGTRTSNFESRAAKVKFLASDELKEKLGNAGFEVGEVKRIEAGGYFVSSWKS
jgi:ubiquinone/menaquinone biosynthesis C-methylase UbiE